MSLKFYNTLTRSKEEFNSIKPNEVKMYSCGPTVYNFAHIGNLRSYVFADVLRKTLEYSGYNVEQIMNITDIGHLSSDADSGEDKMTKGLMREGKTLTLENMRTMAEFYTEKFKDDLKRLNIKLPNGMYYASDYVKEDIDLIEKLEKSGYTYTTSDGVYFNISKDKNYGELRGSLSLLNTKNTESRIKENSEKKNLEDFALWKFSSHIGFPSPWGIGFPGWHIECSAMSMKFLGEQIDIHTGGIDHISIHHTNEISQSECATGKRPFVNYWLHNEFIDISGNKMAKSDDNFFKISTLIEKNINPIAYRFWLLMANYRTKMNFNWDALLGAEVALNRLFKLYAELTDDVGEVDKEYQNKFRDYIEDDMDTPRALALLWDLIKDENISAPNKKATILDFDKVLGLGFENIITQTESEIPDEIIKIVEQREQARKEKNYEKSDELRDKINSLGFEVKDLPVQKNSEKNYKISKI
jgi:cysteinyl-tRNA synthetase